MNLLTVSKLAERVGASADTLRYYERIGLLPPAERSPSGYRLYGEDAITRMQFIKGAQRLGLRLEEIGELVHIREQGLCPCGHTRHLLTDRLAQLDSELEALGELRKQITAMLDQGLAQPDDGCNPSFIQITGVRKGGTT